MSCKTNLNSNWNAKIAEEARAMQSKRTSVPVRHLHVQVSVDGMAAFNNAFVREGIRKNPLMAEKVNLTADELLDFEKFLLAARIDIVDGKCTIFRSLKRLAMPCFVERILSDVGRVFIRDRGLDIHPVVGDDFREDIISLEKAIEISNKVEAFYDDLAVVVGAMPGDEGGNLETMTLSLIEGYVVGMGDYDDPLVEYIVYALQCLLIETSYNSLYYMRYDDVRTIEANIAALGRSLVL